MSVVSRSITRGVRHLWRDERGQDLAEYGIALAVIGLVVVFAAMFIGLVNVGMWEGAQQSIANVLGGS